MREVGTNFVMRIIFIRANFVLREVGAAIWRASGRPCDVSFLRCAYVLGIFWRFEAVAPPRTRAFCTQTQMYALYVDVIFLSARDQRRNKDSF